MIPTRIPIAAMIGLETARAAKATAFRSLAPDQTSHPTPATDKGRPATTATMALRPVAACLGCRSDVR